MRLSVFSLLLWFIANMANAQIIKHNVIFNHGEVKLSSEQEKQLSDLASTLKKGERISVFPLIKDTIFDKLMYAQNAKLQADEIAKFAKTIGFELLGMPSNFPSAYKGRSICVNLKYTIATIKQPEFKNYTLQDNFPPKPSQYFIVDPNKDTMIIGSEGTKLLFKAGSLLSQHKVEIELKEFYKLSDYMKSNLPTVSDGEMIITGGSIYLNATEANAGKKQVKINPDKGVPVDFTLGKADPAMQIFIKDPRSGDEMNWILPSKTVRKESWEMIETLYDYDGSIISQRKFTSKQEWENYVKEQQAIKEKEKKQEEIKQATRNKMDSKLTIYDLGYINCDKFANEPMVAFNIDADENITAEYYMIFNEIRGVMKGSVDNNRVAFGNLPQNRKASLIAVSFIDKQAYFYKTQVTPGNKEKPKIVLAPVDENFLNQQLSLLK